MDDQFEKQVQQRLQELPEDVRNAVHSADLDSKVQLIGQKNGLHIDQEGELQDEVLMVMLGFVTPEGFVTALEKNLNLPKEKADAIAAAVNTEIILPIRESLKSLTQAKKDTQVPTPEAGASVVMPSSKPVETPSAPMAIPTPAPAAPIVPLMAQTPAAAPKPALDLHAADAMLSQKQVSVPPSATVAPTPPPTAAPAPAKPVQSPGQPQNYKADPYREPVE